MLPSQLGSMSNVKMKLITCCKGHDKGDGTTGVTKVPGCRWAVEAADNGRSYDADREGSCVKVLHELLRQILCECVILGQADILQIECSLHTIEGVSQSPTGESLGIESTEQESVPGDRRRTPTGRQALVQLLRGR